MVCIYCSGPLDVSNSRPQKGVNQVWRRRCCKQCGTIFTTNECIDYAKSIAVIDHSGALAPFSRDKLLFSILKSCQHRPSALADAIALTDTILQRIVTTVANGSVSHTDIIKEAHDTLEHFDKAASVHYLAYHPSTT